MKRDKAMAPGGSEKWYDKFSKKKPSDRCKTLKEEKSGKIYKKTLKNKNTGNAESVKNPVSGGRNKIRVFVAETVKMFSDKNLPPDAKKILTEFLSVIQNIRPLNSRQLAKIPMQIRELSHELTDERPDRRKSYMNETVKLSSYVRYFMWWNLIRLTKLFAGFAPENLCLEDGDVCLDAGSGPLTVVTALWLSRPELRKKKLTWYCLDISQAALTLGEEIFLSIAAKTLPEPDSFPWKIIRLKGEMGLPVKQRASFITCANMLNEMLEYTAPSARRKSDFFVKKFCEDLLNYADEKASVLLIEPGVPQSARLVSAMRKIFIDKGYEPVLPCPHAAVCPMDGKRGQKWCNFAFTTEDSPLPLLKLSADAGLPKDRAVLSFVLVSNRFKKRENDETDILRIVSDPIKLPDAKKGYYACSKQGMLLAIDEGERDINSGDKISTEKLPQKGAYSRDKKTGAGEIFLRK
ncbi:small ribosomal subunit Rsm22 family protein [Treponema parvum]|uniref:small ribosomal subunit Rsm22 family protein n=1 Tax=Treponema parvum TaxID=138851 RepID=UPI001AEC28BC|nr:small ribosomal subunit Rsm22 family protein [Treponema parvum]QTQ17298.1 hypothetical protein HXT04_11720 [Treponema parvum]